METSNTIPILISIDIETTGPRKKKHAITEIGAIAMIPGKTPTILSSLEVRMTVPSDRGWDQKCVAEFWEKDPVLKARMEEINAGGYLDSTGNKCKIPSPTTGMQQFVDWVNEILIKHCEGDPDRIIFWSDFPSFDIAWIDEYLEIYLNHDPIHLFFPNNFSMPFCLTSYAYGISRRYHSTKYFSKTCAAREVLGVPAEMIPNVPHDHRAIHDAENMIIEHNIILNHLLVDEMENTNSSDESNESSEERKVCAKCGEEFVLLQHLCVECQKSDDEDENAVTSKKTCHEMLGKGKKKSRCENAAVEQYDFKFCRRHGANHYNRRVQKDFPPDDDY